MRTARVLAVMIIAIGVICVAWSFVELSAASLPYPDPTPELLIKQSEQIEFWSSSLLLSFVVLGIGCVALWRNHRKK